MGQGMGATLEELEWPPGAASKKMGVSVPKPLGAEF